MLNNAHFLSKGKSTNSVLLNKNQSFYFILGDVIKFTLSGTVRDMRISNGDTIHVFPLIGTRFAETDQPQASTSASTAVAVQQMAVMSFKPPVGPALSAQVEVVEDQVDQVIDCFKLLQNSDLLISLFKYYLLQSD